MVMDAATLTIGTAFVVALLPTIVIMHNTRSARLAKAAEVKAAAEAKAVEIAEAKAAKAAEADERREDQRLAFARQDQQAADLREVAAQAAKAAELLAEQNREIAAGTAEVARLAKANNVVVAANAAEQKTQLQSIHTIVNSSFTVLAEQLLSTTEEKLALQLEVADLRGQLGTSASVEVLALIESTRARITEMKASLADRVEKTKDAETKASIATAITGAAYAAGVAAGEAKE